MGKTAFDTLEAVQPRLVRDLQRGAVKTLKIPLTAPANGSETDTNVDLPDRAIVFDVYVDVTTAESTGGTKTLDVGLLSSESGGDADGFLNGVSVASTGLVQGSLVSGGQTLGTLLHVDESGGGVLVREPFLTDSVTAKSVSITAGSADWEEFVGDLYFVILEPTLPE